MRNEIWAAHTWMQTISAYPNGPMATERCHLDRARTIFAKGGLRFHGGHMLIIGPGTAAEIAQAKDVFDPAHVDAMTLSADEIGPIRAAGFSCELGDMHDAPFANEAFELIFSSNVLEHAIAPHVALLECRRMLKPAGCFYAIVPTHDTAGGACTPWHVHCFDHDTWRWLFQKAGFAIAGFDRVTERLAEGAVEHYYHIRAHAVTPPAPHDEVLRRISELKR